MLQYCTSYPIFQNDLIKELHLGNHCWHYKIIINIKKDIDRFRTTNDFYILFLTKIKKKLIHGHNEGKDVKFINKKLGNQVVLGKQGKKWSAISVVPSGYLVWGQSSQKVLVIKMLLVS